MNTIKWDVSINVGIEELDQQHQRLIAKIQEVEDSVKLGRDQEKIKKVVEQFIDYIDFHFKTEERVFQITNYPDAENHIKEHTAFFRKVSKFISDYKNERFIASLYL